MLRPLSLMMAFAIALSAGFAAPSDAGSRRGMRTYSAPLKDCTRLNGRFGYYGNPWCSPAEQRAWDRAQGRRSR